MTQPLTPQTVHRLSDIVYKTDRDFQTIKREYPDTSSTDIGQRLLGRTKSHLSKLDTGYTNPSAFGILTASSGAFGLDLLSGFGFVAEGGPGRPGELVLATRGTNFQYNKFDLLTDMDAGLDIGPKQYAVHQGFHKTFKGYQNDLLCHVTDYGRRMDISMIHCVGHSLGGALANLNAMALRAAGYNVSLYTIGAPRVGLFPFALDLVRNIPAKQIFRVVNPSDPVPMVPVFPFWHASSTPSEYEMSGGNIISLSSHLLSSGYAPMQRMTCWKEFGQANPLEAINQGNLEEELGRYGGATLHNSSVLRMIGIAVVQLLKATGLVAAAALQGPLSLRLTVVDLLIEALRRASNGAAVLVEEASSIVGAMLKFLGRPLEYAQKLSLDLIRAVVNAFAGEMNNRATQALMMASKVQ